MNTFMGRKVHRINENLYELMEECICEKDDIRHFKEFIIGVLYSPIAEDIISVRYFIVGFPERYKLMDYMDDGTIMESNLRYIENPSLDNAIGGIERV